MQIVDIFVAGAQNKFNMKWPLEPICELFGTTCSVQYEILSNVQASAGTTSSSTGVVQSVADTVKSIAGISTPSVSGASAAVNAMENLFKGDVTVHALQDYH